MTIDWIHYTPYRALAGGLLIGLAAVVLWLANGRVAGISGIAGGVVRAAQHRQAGSDAYWRVAFLCGLMMAPLMLRLAAVLPTSRVDAGYGVLIGAGLLVGFGTRLGSGCTSGHGVCGLARLSRRSLAATLVFMACGFLTVFLMRHVLLRGLP